MFHVVNLATSEPIHAEETGTPIAFATGDLAAEEAKRLTEATGVKHQPRRIAMENPDAWLNREANKFASGVYMPLPWHTAPWFAGRYPLHFAHVSTDKPGMVAYTESPEKGQLDRQTRVRPGAYLTKYFSNDLSQATITDLARDFAIAHGTGYDPDSLQYARTSDEIVAVYVACDNGNPSNHFDGLSSCMAYPTNHFSSKPIHPVSVYANGDETLDLTLAYMTDESGKPIARAMVWEAKKIYGRVYAKDAFPDHGRRLTKALRDLGFSDGYDSGNEKPFTGARLMRVEHDRGIVAPYVDGHSYASNDGGKYLYLTDSRRGDIDLNSTSGIGCDLEDENDENFRECAHCGDEYDSEDEGSYIDSRDQSWCGHCTDNHAFFCQTTGTVVANYDGVALADGTYMSESAFERYGFHCDATDENYDSRETDSINMNDGETWCADYFNRHGFRCMDCHENFPNDDKHKDSFVCEACAEESEREILEAVEQTQTLAA
jgi:hypothetical protein